MRIPSSASGGAPLLAGQWPQPPQRVGPRGGRPLPAGRPGHGSFRANLGLGAHPGL